MVRKLRLFYISLTAALALGALSAATAEAAGELHMGSVPAVLTAQQQIQQLVFGVGVGLGIQIGCTNATFEGETTEAVATDITVTPKFSGCKLFMSGIEPKTATIKMNGCKFTFTGGAVAQTFNFDIAGCTAGKKLEIISGQCTFKYGEQGPISHVVAQKVTGSSPSHIALSYTVAGIQYQEVGALCPDGNGTVGNNGALTGITTVKAFELVQQNQVTEGAHQFIEDVCGSQVELFPS